MFMTASVPPVFQTHPSWEQYQKDLSEAQHLSGIVWIALQMGLLLARIIVEQELEQRAKGFREWGNCPTCEKRLHSKGWQSRSIQTLVGKID
jgi:hypothetical protein